MQGRQQYPNVQIIWLRNPNSNVRIQQSSYFFLCGTMYSVSSTDRIRPRTTTIPITRAASVLWLCCGLNLA